MIILQFQDIQKNLLNLHLTQVSKQKDLLKLKNEYTNIKQKLIKNQNQQKKLADEQKMFENKLSQASSDLNTTRNDANENAKKYNQLNQYLDKSRQDRNVQLLSWWMKRYPVFNLMTLEQLKTWLIKAISSNKPVINNNQLKLPKSMVPIYVFSPLKNHTLAYHTILHKSLSKQDLIKLCTIQNGVTIKKSDLLQDSGQSLADKQRIYTNQQENDPIDTVSETEDPEQESSPFGYRDIDGDISKYRKEHDLDNDNHKITSKVSSSNKTKDELDDAKFLKDVENDLTI